MKCRSCGTNCHQPLCGSCKRLLPLNLLASYTKAIKGKCATTQMFTDVDMAVEFAKGEREFDHFLETGSRKGAAA